MPRAAIPRETTETGSETPRPDLAGRVLALEADALRVDARAAQSGTGPLTSPLGWGLGFYQGGEVLMRRRPLDDHGLVVNIHTVDEDSNGLLPARADERQDNGRDAEHGRECSFSHRGIFPRGVGGVNRCGG